ncbi:ATP-binding protein [Micromonospora yasonensis]|uniref:ATP-binding protein n=1 Tax=Micromonospora yasonensis TaxID=1128667 RepID=UPI00222F5CB9|nr:ATP-binding protein [Micromonospora yasonensis]MCW3842862.1 ATP-binding protein [Micromonospora yasonensis]
MTSELPSNLIISISELLQEHLVSRVAGHCVRVDDLAIKDAHAIADEIADGDADCDVHVLAPGEPKHRLDIKVDRAVELRNRKRRPLLLLVPAGTGHAASSLDNSFEPLPLIGLLNRAAAVMEQVLAATPAAPAVAELRKVLGRARQIESWARFLSMVAEDPTTMAVGRHLWQVSLIPDLEPDGLESRMRQNAKAVAAIARPTRPSARVRDRLIAADVKDGALRQELLSYLEQQEAGALANPAMWARELGDKFPGKLTFDQWPIVESQQASLTEVAITPFRRDNGSVDPQCKLRLGDDAQLYCDVSTEQPGSVVVKWTTTPAKTTAVANWRLEVLPPTDLRTVDTAPVAWTKVKGDKRRATLRLDISEDDLAAGTLFVVVLRAQDADGNDLNQLDGSPATAESDQFEVILREYVPERNIRKAGADSLAEAVLRTAVEIGGDLTEDAAVWDPAGQVFGVRVGGRRMVLIRLSRVIAQLQRRMAAEGILAFDAFSPLGEPIDTDDAMPVPLPIPTALADRRRRLLAAIAARTPRDVVETLQWDDELRSQARSYLTSFRRALENADNETRTALLTMDTLMVRVGTATGEKQGLVLLPTHPLRLNWVSAHDHILRTWAEEVRSRTPKTARVAGIDLSLVARLSPANLPFTLMDRQGQALVYAEELTHGSALYLAPGIMESQAVSDAVCAAIDVARDGGESIATARALHSRVNSYRAAHPGTGPLRLMAMNPGSGRTLQKALAPLALPAEPRADEESMIVGDGPQRLEIIAYSDHLSYTDPVSELRSLQRSVTMSELQRSTTHLAPALGLAVRRLDRVVNDEEGHHLAVVQDIARGSVAGAPAELPNRTTAFRDLLTPLWSIRQGGDDAEWVILPALKARGSGRVESEMVETHRGHQEAVAAALGLRTNIPALAVRLSSEELSYFRAAHDRADWVITLDQAVGSELFENESGTDAGQRRYLLDYTPDFLEGLGKKLTVTTSHHGEVLRILSDALKQMGLSQEAGAAARVLNRLLLVSGRLALRLLRDTTLSIEAVSLAALMGHLQGRNQLEGRIVVPVDSHPEIFGMDPGSDEHSAQRCDLILVRVTQRSLRLECIEVKGRREALLPAALAERIVDQLDNTERMLLRQFFATDPPRQDGVLQRARLTGLLHYYADRSARHGLIAADKIDEVHRNIDRIEEAAEAPEITKTGYVISLTGSEGFPARHRDVPIKVLSADDLGRAGFTTIRSDQPASSDTPKSEPPSVNPTSAKSADGTDAPAPGSGSRETSAPVAGLVAANGGISEVPPRESVVVELGVTSTGNPVTWNVSTKGSPHAFVLGIPGQGKSVTTRRVINEFSAQGLPSFVLDFHGDMAADPPRGAHVVDAAQGIPISPFELAAEDVRSVNQTAWEIAEIIAYVCGLGEIQRNHVYSGLQQAYQDRIGRHAHIIPTMAEVSDAVEKVEKEGRGKNARDRIRPITDFGLFAPNPDHTFAEIWKNGVVVDLSGLTLETVQLAASAFLLRKIYREMFRWEQVRAMRLAVVLDEAHRLAKDVTLPKLMKEGRKYGVSVLVASQAADDFHRDILANAGTKIVFRTNFPASKAAAGFLRGRAEEDLSRQIEQLPVGSAYVSTPDQSQARRTYMHSDE